MKVLVFTSYPVEAAATRYRLLQYIAPLAERKINLTVVPFLSSEEFSALYKPGQTFQKALWMLNAAGKRFFHSFKTHNFDALLIQREAMLFGPPFFEWLSKTIGKCPLILDLDDATYVPYISPTYGRIGSALKFFGKADRLIKWSDVVICGNRYIAEYVESKGRKAVIVPTVVDTEIFFPIEKKKEKTPVVGWIGTHSTFPLLETLFPVLQNLSRKYNFTLKIVGAGVEKIKLDGVKIENLNWELERETADFQSLDIGLYPLAETGAVNKEWLKGKSGFKAIQYMAVGIPFVVTPVGICAEIGIENKTHFAASNQEQWSQALAKLLESHDLRNQMGKKGRDYSLHHYTVGRQTDKIAGIIEKAVGDYI